ncbi:MAG: hypothetical protein M1837_004127 [Sclerophora amabilis]|nr:MAG: hypothetical protein M1837_004127 [Sclerophora amabilis]
MPLTLNGSCQCGGVQFSLQSHTPVPYQLCACSICRKVGGYNGSVNLGGLNDTMKIAKGKDMIKKYHGICDRGTPTERTVESIRAFCSACGSMLWVYDSSWPKLIHPFASAIDSPLEPPEEMVCVKADSKPDWVRWPEGQKQIYQDYGPDSIDG